MSALNELRARDVMTPEVLMVGADWTVDQLAEFFIGKSISGAPVVAENGTLIGVVSLTDIVRHDSLSVEESHTDVPHGYYIHGLQHQYAQEELASFRVKTGDLVTVSDIMTPMIFDVFEETTVQQIAETMTRGCIHRVFVTREKKVVGIITALDLLKVVWQL